MKGWRNIQSLQLIICCAIVGLVNATAHAWSRVSLRDDVLIARAELAVIAHVKERSIQYIPHPGGASCEHRVVLVVTDVVKGTCKDRELPILIHYGLEPVVNGRSLSGRFRTAVPPGQPEDVVKMYDTGDLGIPVSDDLGNDHLWILQTRPSDEQRGEMSTGLGISEPSEIRSPDLKPYFLALMSDQVEQRLKSLASEETSSGRRSLDFLEHLAVERIAKLPDLNERAEKLLPLAFREVGQGGAAQQEARFELIKCGVVAGARLEALFYNPRLEHHQNDIIAMWGSVKYALAEPLLIQILKQEDEFWSKQHLPRNRWWLDAPDSETDRLRSRSREKISAAARSLGDVARSQQAVLILQQTLKRWQAMPRLLDMPDSLVGICEASIDKCQSIGLPIEE